MIWISITNLLASLAIFHKLSSALTVTPEASYIGVQGNKFASLTVTINPSTGVTGHWSKVDLFGNDAPIDLSGGIYIESGLGNLIILSFTNDLAGLYVFHATDGVNTAQNDPITVYEIGSPTVSTTMTEELVSIGQTITLQCSVTSGEVIRDINWMHTSTDGTSAYIDETDTSRYSGSIPGTPSLTILSVVVADIGDYWCYAEDTSDKTGISTQIRLVLEAGLPSATHTPVVDISTVIAASYSTMDATTIQMTSLYTTPTIIMDVTTSEMTSLYTTPTINMDAITSEMPSLYTTPTINMDATTSEMTSLYTTQNRGGKQPQVTSLQTTQQSSSPSIFASSSQDRMYITQSTTEQYTSLSSTVTQANSNAGPTVQGTPASGEFCPCDCIYQSKLAYWATQNLTKYTMEELRIILKPELDEIENNLRVNKKNLSSTIRKLTSAKDNRPAAKQIGSIGIVFLILILSTVVAADLFSIKQHINTILLIWNIKSHK